jgi:hypothetical protein
MAKGKIGFVQEAPTDKLRVKDSWEKKIGNVTVVYSTEGVVGSGYIHNVECRRANAATATSTQTSGQRLTREEIERLPRLAEWVAQHAGKGM